MANDKVIALTATGERPAATLSGYAMLMVLLLAIIAVTACAGPSWRAAKVDPAAALRN